MQIEEQKQKVIEFINSVDSVDKFELLKKEFDKFKDEEWFNHFIQNRAIELGELKEKEKEKIDNRQDRILGKIKKNKGFKKLNWADSSLYNNIKKEIKFKKNFGDCGFVRVFYEFTYSDSKLEAVTFKEKDDEEYRIRNQKVFYSYVTTLVLYGFGERNGNYLELRILYGMGDFFNRTHVTLSMNKCSAIVWYENEETFDRDAYLIEDSVLKMEEQEYEKNEQKRKEQENQLFLQRLDNFKKDNVDIFKIELKVSELKNNYNNDNKNRLWWKIKSLIGI